MDPKFEKPLRLFLNPFTIWTDLALKTGQAMWASAYAAAARSNAAANVAVIPTSDAPAPKAQDAAKPAEPMLALARAEVPRKAEVAVLRSANAPPKARASRRQASKAARSKATRAKLRNKANAKRHARH
jgi:hypothetical protein